MSSVKSNGFIEIKNRNYMIYEHRFLVRVATELSPEDFAFLCESLVAGVGHYPLCGDLNRRYAMARRQIMILTAYRLYGTVLSRKDFNKFICSLYDFGLTRALHIISFLYQMVCHRGYKNRMQQIHRIYNEVLHEYKVIEFKKSEATRLIKQNG